MTKFGIRMGSMTSCAAARARFPTAQTGCSSEWLCSRLGQWHMEQACARKGRRFPKETFCNPCPSLEALAASTSDLSLFPCSMLQVL